MLTPVLCCLILQLSPQNTLTLSRGVTLPGRETRYWSCEDTSLDRRNSKASNGQGTLLYVGVGNRALIRFGDLERALGPHKRITRARLIMTAEDVRSGGQMRLHRFGADWNEGVGAGEKLDTPPQWSTSWDFQFYNQVGKGHRWRNGAVEFMAKESSASVQVAKGQTEIVFDGLAGDIQRFYDRWYENHGWAIEFSGEAALNSAQSASGRPRLEVEVEAAPPAGGPDLSVTYISRAPEYERYDNRADAYVRNEVGGHESGVMMNPGKADAKKWPADGEEVTYTAVVKNVGTEAAQGFSYQWMENGRAAKSGELQAPLEPRATVEVTFSTRFRNEHHDHRTQPIGLRLTPAGRDALACNNFLEVQACALNIGIWVDQAFYDMFAKQPNGVGSRSFEDWIQWQFRIWNDVFMRHSRFSFAPDGCRERIRVQRITIVPNGTLKGGAHIPNDTPTLTYDGEWGFDSSFGEAEKYADAVRQSEDRALLHELSHQIGLIDLYWMNVDPSLPDGTGGKVRLKHGGAVVTRGAFDPFSGLMGGGDTRNEGLLPGALPLTQEHRDDPALRNPFFEPTDLYALTDVGALNANLQYRRGFYGEFLYSVPAVVAVRCVDRNGVLIPEGTLAFFQMKGGEIREGPSDFTVNFSKGAALLPNRPTGLDLPFTVATGHTLKPNPFGRIDVVGTNGVFLVRLDYQGQTEWAWMKVWQLADAFFRGNKSAYVHELRFNVTLRPVKPENLALKKVAIDKANSSGQNLANLLDGDPKTLYSASDATGDWVEIDIGRDRPIGEVRLVISGAYGDFWEKFDILVYSTGQTLSEARVYASEKGWRASVGQRRDVSPNDFDVRSVAYRSRPQTVRFIRIVNRSGGAGRLAEVEIRETEPGP